MSTTIQKTVAYIRQYFFLLALVAIFVGFSAFKFAKTFDDPEDGWYEVYIESEGDPNNPADQQIGTRLSVAPPLSDTTQCARSNFHKICAIELRFDEDENGQLPEMPSTVEEADDDGNELVTILDSAHLPTPSP